jgi:uncharacterized membrane protein
MKSWAILVLVVSLILGLNFISASNYIEFNQVGDKIVVKQNLSGIYSSYVDPMKLEKTSNDYVFLKRLQFNKTLDNLTIKLNLDSGFIIANQNAYPINYELETDGQTISLVWKINNLNKDESFAMFVDIKSNSSSSLIIIISLVLVLIILTSIGWWIYFKLFKNKKSLSSKFEQHLLESENKVISELKKADRNELWQKQLQLATGFSKAKLSRVIRNLESRDLIRKIPMGNTNKICLK